MPLIDTLSPIDKILEKAGVTQKSATLDKKLTKSRLDSETLLDQVSDIISNGDSDAVRLQAIKVGLQLNPETRQAMNDEKAQQVPVFNIFIKDPQSLAINQILVPRLKNNVVEINNP